jgi:tyrosinase
LALYEQVLYNIIQEIAGEFNGTDRNRYTQAARTFRAPYWDWAAAPPNNGPVLPTSLSEARVEVNSPTGRRTINNPLYQYTFHPLSTNDFPDSPLSTWPSTLRYPSDSSPNAQSRNNLVEEQLRNNRLSYRDRIYNLFTAYNNYTEFSSKAWFPSDGGNYDSIESVHDQIHGLTGNGGHMGYVSRL